METTPAPTTTGMKPAVGVPAVSQPSKIATPPLTGIGKFDFPH